MRPFVASVSWPRIENGLPEKSLSLPPASVMIKDAGSDIPRLELKFPETIEPAASNIAKIERCRSAAANPLASSHERLEIAQIEVGEVAVIVGKSGGEQGLVQFVCD